jgi:predicted DNA-binding protein YlxM (UPF0122 family)
LIINRYFQQDLSAREIAEDMGLKTSVVQRLIASIRYTAKGYTANGPKKRAKRVYIHTDNGGVNEDPGGTEQSSKS